MYYDNCTFKVIFSSTLGPQQVLSIEISIVLSNVQTPAIPVMSQNGPRVDNTTAIPPWGLGWRLLWGQSWLVI